MQTAETRLDPYTASGCEHDWEPLRAAWYCPHCKSTMPWLEGERSRLEQFMSVYPYDWRDHARYAVKLPDGAYLSPCLQPCSRVAQQRFAQRWIEPAMAKRTAACVGGVVIYLKRVRPIPQDTPEK